MKSYCVLTLSRYPDHLDRCLSSIFIVQPKLSLNDVYVVDDDLPVSIKERWKVNYLEGKKPFFFARNFNIGLQNTPKDKDVFFIGDDGMLMTVNGIDRLAYIANQFPDIGAIVPCISGKVKNEHQMEGMLNQFYKRQDLEELPGYRPSIVFYAVYLTRKAIESVGLIPEELNGYGYEDDYFCKKMKKHGFDWGIEPAVLVRHGFGKYKYASSYLRAGLDPIKLQEINRKVYDELKKTSGFN